MDHGAGRERTRSRHDGSAQWDGRLADGGELDRVTAGALECATDAGRHPQGEIGGVHDRVDLQIADVAVPELDGRQPNPSPR